MTKARDWEVIRDRWESDFETVLGALNSAIKEGVSKRTGKEVELAIKITSKHRDLILEILKRAENTDRTLRGSDFAVVGRK